MHLSENTLILSATDLSKFLSCGHLTLLDRLTALGLQPKAPKYDDPALDVLFARGLEHEQAYLEALKAEGLSVVEFEDVPGRKTLDDWRQLASETVVAMRSGPDVIYQGLLFDEPWLGKPDFLRRVKKPSDLGDWSYEVVDTKLAREAKAGAVLQITFYSDLLARVQGVEPEDMVLALGGPDAHPERFRYTDFAAYYRWVRARYGEMIDTADDEAPVAPDPCEYCTICAWKGRCDRERHDVDHLSLVAGITRKQRALLIERSVETLADLASLPLPITPGLDGVSTVAAERIREQARIQLEGRKAEEPRHELLTPVVEGQGLAALPTPSEGDIFFDFEGDPHYEDEGLEYLFGWVDMAATYTGLWALSRQEEKAQFEAFMDFVTSRLAEYPDFHIYHYAPYEPTALKRLMGRHGVREGQVDNLLRRGVFVDLYRVVRQGLRASVESYSIKKMEPFYGFGRDVDLRKASRALADFAVWLAVGGEGDEGPALLEEVEGYNRDDCVSTLRLRDWLEGLHGELEAETGEGVPRPEPPDPDEPEETPEHLQRVEALVTALTSDVPAEKGERSPEEQDRWLLAQLLNWHRREKKSTWWQYFSWLELTDEELIEDRSTMGGLEYEGVVDTVARSEIHRFRFPRQEHSIRLGKTPRDPATGKTCGEVWAINEIGRTVDLKRGKRADLVHPSALLPLDDVPDGGLRESLLRIGDATVSHGLGTDNPYRAAVGLLLRERPRTGQKDGALLLTPDEPTLDGAIRVVRALDYSVLPVQGPPGAGKTFMGARIILDLVRAGKRVGICATSHKVIGNLLDATCDAAREGGYTIRGIQKADEEDRCDSQEIEIGGNPQVLEALHAGGVQLAAGTAWLWSREDMVGSVDVLFVDEAGQFSLANALAVSPAAESLVLLGDPRQLEQPQRGVHPPGADASALDHLLAGEATVPGDRGLFLPETWRLHPDITDFTSEMFYRGRLRSRDGLDEQVVGEGGAVSGAGLRWIPAEHEGNQNQSAEEVTLVTSLVGDLLGVAPTWTDRDGTVQTLGLRDILVVAPYNAQVSSLAEALPENAHVGTVDKFQGQEAPVVIYSMTSSSAEDAPRGMDFLYSANRLNVATSRAMCLVVVVGTAALFGPECKSPKQMRMANAFCRLREMVGGGGDSGSMFPVGQDGGIQGFGERVLSHEKHSSS